MTTGPVRLPGDEDPATRLARLHGLVGLDGLDAAATTQPVPLETLLGSPAASSESPSGDVVPLRLSDDACRFMRAEIERAGGREVCFLTTVAPDRLVVEPRAVARGNRKAMLAAAVGAQQGGLMVHNHPSGVLEPSAADLEVAARVWEEGLGSAIVDNLATQLFVVVEPPEPRVRRLLDAEELAEHLTAEGALARAHPGFEDRPGQRQMLRLVAERLNEGGVAVVEAGTGIGKSLAYLLPAARWASLNKERTVISTNTIQLQEQLVDKDLPLVTRLLGPEVDWALVKGRGNYVSIRRALLALEGTPLLFEDDKSEELEALASWLGTTDDGSLSDLSFQPSHEVWEEVRSDADVCLRARCPHFSACFYQRSRRRAAQAGLLVVNHHLLFTDLSVRRATGNYSQSAVLPPFKHLVLDEAHNVEDAATAHLGTEVSRAGLFRLLSRLDRRGRGLLVVVREALSERGWSEGQHRLSPEGEVRKALDEARASLTDLIEALESGLPPDGPDTLRLGTSLSEPLDDPWTRERLEAVLLAFQRLEREARALRRRVGADEELAVRLEGRMLDLQSVERRLAAAGHSLRLVLDPEEGGQGFVRWLQWRGRGRQANLALAAAPVEPGPLLRDGLFARLKTTVLTSATLSTRRSFQFLRKRLGIAEDGLALLEQPLQVREALIPSPFDFQRQTVLAVPTDLPDAGGSGSRELDEQTARVAAELAELTGGGLFGLFTSHRALRAVAEGLRERGVSARWPLFVQGEASRTRLVEEFTRSGKGILLGTASFWEGVDVPGWPLRALLIQKLPFRVPTEPVTAARIEAAEQEGKDAFWDLLLPLAALRLKQGFGRLVRSRADVGAVVLLDDRILRKRYGRYLRDSLPPAPLVKGPWLEIRRPLAAFYQGSASAVGLPLSSPHAPVD